MIKRSSYDIGHEPILDPPESREPDALVCTRCGEPIYEGESYYRIYGYAVCEHCMDDFREIA